MQGTTTTEGQRHKTRRIKPAFDGYKPDGAGHFCIRHTQNGLSRRHSIQAKRCADDPRAIVPGGVKPPSSSADAGKPTQDNGMADFVAVRGMFGRRKEGE